MNPTSSPVRPAAFGGIPRAHFAPARNWMNDPNGLIFHDGRYHLFFQYNPEGVDHANMSWGHASSADLVNWEEHPVAIRYDVEAQIFSGSAVCDERNTSGLGPAGTQPLVALYTAAEDHRQAQALASSHDGGRTWHKFPGNPVLDRGSREFRDPKVFRYRSASDEYWVLVAVEAVKRQVVLYRSDNLIDWHALSEFGPRGPVDGVWECPDLFPLAVDGADDHTLWVLLISVSEGAPAGGSGTMYVLGEFDGVTFTPMGGSDTHWLDYGRDNYAGVTFSGLPPQERTLIGWMSNWDYAKALPVIDGDARRGAMTLARRLSLTQTADGIRLRQAPVTPPTREVATPQATQVAVPMTLAGAVGECAEITMTVALGNACGFEVSIGHDEHGQGGRVLRFDAPTQQLSHDRTASGDDFPEQFRTVHSMALASADVVTMTVWVDLASVEVFADHGVTVLTDAAAVARGTGLTVRPVGGALADVDVRVRMPL